MSSKIKRQTSVTMSSSKKKDVTVFLYNVAASSLNLKHQTSIRITFKVLNDNTYINDLLQ